MVKFKVGLQPFRSRYEKDLARLRAWRREASRVEPRLPPLRQGWTRFVLDERFGFRASGPPQWEELLRWDQECREQFSKEDKE